MPKGVKDIKNIFVLIGGYGSGKTELAVNLALRAARAGGKVELIDLDMVNTYFRLSERGDLIGGAGIRLVSPNYAMTNIESLSLPAEVLSAFHSDWDAVIFDVGGDIAGAAALGRYKRDFDALTNVRLEVLNVVNVRRPLSSAPGGIIALTRELEEKTRLSVTGFINNSNLARATGFDELRDGCDILRSVSEQTGIPVSYTSGKKEFLDAFLQEAPDASYVGTPLEIITYMHRDWESFVRLGV